MGSSKRLPALAIITIVLLGIALYANSLHGAFFFDDFSCIHDNPQVRSLWPWQGGVESIREIALSGRPVPTLLTAWNFAIGKQDPFTYHCFNLFVHLLNALLLFGIIRRTANHYLKESPAGHSGDRLALSIAALWIGHPLVTEPVNYVIQRTELLMAFGLFAMIYCLARAAIENSRRWQAASVAACAFGMSSKESMVVAPLLALLFDRTFYSGSFRALWSRRRYYYLALAATWLILAGLLLSQPRITTAGFSVSGITPWQYLLTQSQAIFHYAYLVFWPSGLALDYGDWPIISSWKLVWPHLLALGLCLAWVVVKLCYGKVSGFLGAWVFLTLAPTSSFLPIATELVAERRMYVPLVAVIAAVVLLIRKLLNRRLAMSLGLIVFLIFSALTIRRNVDYQSEKGMLEDVCRKHPANARAHYNLGIVLGLSGEFRDAERQFRVALLLNPFDGQAHNNLGAVLEKQGRVDEAFKAYQEALRLGVKRPETYANIERARQALNKRRADH